LENDLENGNVEELQEEIKKVHLDNGSWCSRLDVTNTCCILNSTNHKRFLISLPHYITKINMLISFLSPHYITKIYM
jgi:hypothetical protein